MSFHRSISNGAAQVGSLQAEDILSQVIIKLLRGAAPREADRAVLEAFDALDAIVQRYGRRPFLSHGLGCDCVGADEAVLVQLVRLAGQGDGEDALMLAMLMVRGDVAPMLVSQAQSLALALARDLGKYEKRRASRIEPVSSVFH